MKPNKLIFSQTTKDGGSMSFKHAAGMNLTVITETGTVGSIAVEMYSGNQFEGTRHQREKELINITFDDATMWSGTFDELKQALIK